MHLACAYLEGKSVYPVQPQDLQDHPDESPATADASMDDDGPLPIASTSDSVTALSSRGALAAAHAGQGPQTDLDLDIAAVFAKPRSCA